MTIIMLLDKYFIYLPTTIEVNLNCVMNNY